MRLFHLAKKANQVSILRDGFLDSEVIEAGRKFAGVRLFDDPFGFNPSHDGNDVLFQIEIPEDVLLEYEWVEDGLATRFEYSHSKIQNLREFLAPASLVNSYGPPVAIEATVWADLLDAVDEDFGDT
jgi:hypothetical protein